MNGLFIGTAAWTLPQHLKPEFPVEGTHLERYARVFNGVEINTSFYRDHKAATYAKWAACVPDEFRFSVKLSKVFTHDSKLQLRGRALFENLSSIFALDKKLAVILVQLPPSLAYGERDAESFFTDLRKYYEGPLALESRHKSWLADAPQALIRRLRVTQVSADPDPLGLSTGVENIVDNVDKLNSFAYLRLHGSPLIYKSSYNVNILQRLGDKIKNSSTDNLWCVFDNTTFGHATENALQLQNIISGQRPMESPGAHVSASF